MRGPLAEPQERALLRLRQLCDNSHARERFEILRTRGTSELLRSETNRPLDIDRMIQSERLENETDRYRRKISQ
jgi:hypothetical protein